MKIYIYILPLVLFATIFLAICTTNYDLGVSPDSTSYLEVSNNILDNRGIVDDHGNLVDHWPPMYPAMISLCSYTLKIGTLDASKILNIILIGFYTLLFYLILRLVEVDLITSLIFSLGLIIAKPTTIFTMALSEGLFTVLLLTTIYLYIKYYKEQSIKYILMTGFTSGLLLLTRYAGIGFVIGFSFHLIIAHKISNIHKVKTFIAYNLSCWVPFMAWIYTFIFIENNSIRNFEVHLVTINKIKQFIYTLLTWFGTIEFVLAVLLFTLISLFIYNINKLKVYIFKLCNKNSLYYKLIVSLGVCYTLFLLISISFFDSQIPLNNRLLGPLFPLIMILFSMFFSSILHTNNKIYSALSLLMVSGLTVGSYSIWYEHFISGTGYTNKNWSNSETLSYVEENVSRNIYSNGHDVLNFYNDKNIVIRRLPKKYLSGTLLHNRDYDIELKNMVDKIKNENYCLVYLDSIDWRWYMMDKNEVMDTIDYKTKTKLNDGVIVR